MIVRTGYSFKTAVGTVEHVLDAMQAMGMKYAPIADRCSTFAFRKWRDECAKRDMIPIYGIEIGVIAKKGEKKPQIDYWRFMAKDDIRAVNDLLGLASLNHPVEPLLLYEQALAAEGVFKIVGDRARLDLITPQDDLFVGLTPAISRGYFKAVDAKGLPWLATCDNKYPTADDKELFRLLLGRNASTQTYPQHILSQREWENSVYLGDQKNDRKLYWGIAVLSSAYVLDNCKAKLPQGNMMIPEKPKTLEEMCVEGAKELGVDLADPVYQARLKRELALINEKQYEDYFHIIADLVSWAKKRMIVGAGRGSSCGSLVCFLLGITTIDPIKYDLIFERFIDVNRNDLPDIDIDFSDVRRHLVFDQAEKIYGVEHVARLGSVNMFKSTSVLNECSKNLKIPKWELDQLSKALVERDAGDNRNVLEETFTSTKIGKELIAKYPELMIACRMENHPNTASQHAAGIIITKDPVSSFVAVDFRKKSAMCDKVDAEKLNLLKIDALGLSQLSIFERCLELIGKPSRNGFLETIPLDDQKAFDILNQGKFSGIFQFTGKALQGVTKQVHVSEFEDLVSITALSRPGTMAAGFTQSWCNRKSGKEAVSSIHSLFDPYLKSTLGVITYQEQIMDIIRNIGGMSWEDVTAVRKAISKSMGGDALNQYRAKFIEGAVSKGMTEHLAIDVWARMCKFGSYAFNKSHAVAYGMISYQCCWLKAHYPLEFAAATLDGESDPSKQLKLLRELHAEGIDYQAFNIKHSSDKWTPTTIDGKPTLIAPISAIKGIGSATMHEIISSREDGKPVRQSLLKKMENAKTEIGDLFPVKSAVAKLDLEALNIVSKIEDISTAQCGFAGDILVTGVVKKMNQKSHNDPEKLAKRGYAMTGQTDYLIMHIEDDSDEVMCMVDRNNFERLAKPILEKGGVGKSLYAVKGNISNGFRMINIKQIKYLGDVK